MATAAIINEYRPDYAVPPGLVLAERLEAHGVSQAEFARRCGRSAKLVSEIIAGKAPIEPKTAIEFEKVLGVDADVWLGIEKDYRLHRTRAAEAKAAKAASAWANLFPINELVKRGVIGNPAPAWKAVPALLSFFGVASVEAWQDRYQTANVAYRHSPSFKSDRFALAAWLRIAEIDADGQTCSEYRKSEFKKALRQIRRLTRDPVREAIAESRRFCNNAGVALAPVKPFSKTRLSGAAWWLSPQRPVIALSARHKTDDHLWFSLFHEAAHLLLHSKRDVFLDGARNDEGDLETEANEWAADFLIPDDDWRRFVDSGAFDRVSIRRFANEQEIAAGIVVGRLQHAKRVPWSNLNDLKTRLEWTAASRYT